MLKRLVAAALVTLLPVGVSAQVVEYYHLDLIGNVRAVTNQATAVVERHDYQPFGEEWNPQPGTQPKRFTGKERDAETGLDYFGARYYGSKIARFTTIDPVYTWRDNLADPQRWNRYAYVRGNPLRYKDPDGRVIDTVVDIAFIAYDLFDIGRTIYRGETVTTTQLTALAADVAGAAVPFATGGGVGVRVATKADTAAGFLRAGDKAGDANRFAGHSDDAARTFDQARREAFERAGMTNPADVRFTKVDPATGTVVEFKGPGGAKVAYDGPHATPGPAHDTQHVGWQTGGKRSEGGTRRGNIPYVGPRHPSRSPKKGEGAVEPH